MLDPEHVCQTHPTVCLHSISGVRKSGQSCVVLVGWWGGDGTEADGGFTSELRQYVGETLLLWGRVKDLLNFREGIPCCEPSWE